MENKNNQEYSWISQIISEDCREVECPEYDAYKDFNRDPSGYYVLIKVEWDRGRLCCALCDKKHTITHVFYGKKAQDIYNAIFDFEKKHKIEWFKEKSHIAYLGKELKKAEIAMSIGIKDYFQE